MSKQAVDGTFGSDAAAPMDQVRELLFGTQMKDMETRFQRQEERFQRELADARDAMKKRLDSLENFMQSETASLLNRIKEERGEREEALKTEQRDRAEAVKAEARERTENIKSEARERCDAIDAAAKELAAASEAFDRKIAKLSSSLDTAEQELRRLLMAESGSMAEKIEEKYQDALNALSHTAAQIRQDMVHRSALSGLFTEAAVKLSGQWTPELGHMLSGASAQEDVPANARGKKGSGSPEQ